MSETLERASLLVIDVQNDFCPGGKLPVRKGDLVIPVINRVMGKFPIVIATQDWHPPHHISFASSHEGKKPYDSMMINGIDQVLWPDHCIQGTEGADFHPGLDKRRIHLILRKGTRPMLDSYSAFFENDRTTSTGLSYYLKGLDIMDVYVCGLATDVCVFYSAMDAVKLGFKTFLIENASRGVDVPEGNLEKTRADMKRSGIGIIQSGELS